MKWHVYCHPELDSGSRVQK